MNVLLVGDSLVDNYKCFPNKDLKTELTGMGYNVENLGVENCTLETLINGVVPSSGRFYPYKTDNDGKSRPLDIIEKKTKIDCVVLSIGFNEINKNYMFLLNGTESLLKNVFTTKFKTNIVYIIKKIKEKCDKIIVITPYSPYMGQESPYNALTKYKNELYSSINDFYCSICREYNIPVLDLSRSIDLNNREHYGNSELELNDTTNNLIAKSIDAIVTKYDGHRVYFSEDFESLTVESYI